MTRKQWAALSLSLLGAASAASSPRSLSSIRLKCTIKRTAFYPPITNGTQNYSNAGIAKNYE